MAKKKYRCEDCRFCAYAEKKPNSLFARILRWHRTWCPEWKGYQRSLAQQKESAKP